MESSEPSSCDISSVTSDSSVIFRPPAAPMDSSKMSLAPPRADREMKMIEEAASSMLSVFDHFRPRLTEAQYAYYCQYGSSCLNEAMDKKLRKVNRTYMDSTLNRVETASMAGSMRSLSTVPLYDIYSSNIPSAQLPMYARPPTFAPSVVSDYPRQPAFGSIPQRLMHSGHSSGYSSIGVDSHNRTYLASMSNPQSNLQRQQPVSSRRQNGTLVQALNESVAVSSSPEPKVRPNPHRRARAESEHRHPDRRRRSPSPASSQSSVSVPDQTQEKAKKSTIAVPKRQKGVVELKNWSIKLVGEELCVTGFTHDKSQVTSGSVTRYSYPTIVTTKGSFLVIGEPGHGERTPGFIKSACAKGFPRQWKALSRRWLTERQARRKSTPKKTPERKNTSKIKPHQSSASKLTPNTAGKLKASKSSPALKPHNKVQKKNRSSPSSHSDKENKASKRRSKSLESTLTRGQSSFNRNNVQTKKSKKLPIDNEFRTKKSKRPPTDDEDESDAESPVPAKNSRMKPAASRSNPDIAHKKKQNAPPPTDDESESEVDETIIESSIAPSKRKVLQERGSDTSWDTSSAAKPTKHKPTASKQNTPKATAPAKSKVSGATQKQPSKAQQGSSKAQQGSSKAQQGSSKAQQGSSKAQPPASKVSGAVPKNPSNSKPKEQAPAPKKTGSKKPESIFGDSPAGNKAYFAEDAFAGLGGDRLFTIPCSRSMTPNTLVASIQPDAGTIGRYTPPLQSTQHLFPPLRSNRTLNSSIGSPSTLNSSRDNLVSRRVAKDVVEASKKGGKKKRKIPEPEAPGELADLVKSLKSNSNGLKTPTIVKKVFRNQQSSEDDESVTDKDDSIAY